MEELLARHRKEAKDLQNKITSKKKNATKKTRKGVNDECASLETAMKERHAAELAALSSTANGEATTAPPASASTASEAGVMLIDPFATSDNDSHDSNSAPPNIDTTTSNLATDISTNQHISPSDAADDTTPRRKGNRQKARLARRAAEQDAAIAAAASEASSGPDLRQQERETVDAALAARGLAEVEVRSDGHCLYAAVADQVAGALGLALPPRTNEATGVALEAYKVVRAEVADEMLGHPDDYAPFLDESDALAPGQGVAGYAKRVRDTAEWGGHLELLACARRWRLVLNVLQGDGRVERIDGTEGKEGGGEGREAWLVYYRHSFGLGEHYNSLRKKA